MAVVFFGAATPTATPPRISGAENEHECRLAYERTHKTVVCSEALGAWLPPYLKSIFAPVNPDAVTRGVAADVFVFSRDGKRLMPPAGATFFSYGSALPKGSIFYDPIHRLALFSQSCCAWGETVLTRTLAPPPLHLHATDLRVVRTKAGIRIGSRASDVVKRYGPARAYPLPGHPGFEVLSYTSRRRPNDTRTPCGSNQNFFLHAGRVVSIQLGGGC